MSLHHNPRIVTDGLVFAYDMDNTAKSFKGRPLTNSYNDIFTSQSMRTHTKHYWNGKKWIINSTYTHPGYPGPKGVFLGKVAKHVSGAFNSSWSGNSYGYMLRDISGQTNGEYYTQSCWVYVSKDSNITAIPSVIEGESSGETSASSGEPTLYDMNNKGTWQRIAKRAISDGTVRYIPVYPRRNGVTDGSFTGAMLWGGAQVEDGSNVSQLVDAGDGVATRSNTQALLDMSKSKNTVTATSLTYNSDGTFEFDGVGGVGAAGDYLSCGNSSDVNFGTGNFTLSFFSNRTATGYQGGSYVSKGNGTSLGFDFRDSNFYVHGSSGLIASMSFNPSQNSMNHHTFVFDRSSSPYINYYLNGEYSSSSTTNNSANIGSSIDTTRDLDIGRSQAGGVNRYFNGTMPIVKLYNRALTAAEIKQNFNATKGRFGI